jgi:hypothetical protein
LAAYGLRVSPTYRNEKDREELKLLSISVSEFLETAKKEKEKKKEDTPIVQELNVCIRVYDSPVGRNAKTAAN